MTLDGVARVAREDACCSAQQDQSAADARDVRDQAATRGSEVGLARQHHSQEAAPGARAARPPCSCPLLAGVLVAYRYREDLFGADSTCRSASLTVIALVILGWAFARDVGRAARARRSSAAWTRRRRARSAS